MLVLSVVFVVVIVPRLRPVPNVGDVKQYIAVGDMAAADALTFIFLKKDYM